MSFAENLGCDKLLASKTNELEKVTEQLTKVKDELSQLSEAKVLDVSSKIEQLERTKNKYEKRIALMERIIGGIKTVNSLSDDEKTCLYQLCTWASCNYEDFRGIMLDKSEDILQDDDFIQLFTVQNSDTPENDAVRNAFSQKIVTKFSQGSLGRLRNN